MQDIVTNKELLFQKMQKLCHGLDDKSSITVSKIITRLQHCYEQKTSYIDTITLHEKQQLERMLAEFYPNIFQIKENVYCYGKYFLPVNFFLPEVFWDKHCLQAFDNIKNIATKNIIDVGGCIGDSALVLQDFTDKYVYTFEATKRNYELTLQTLKLNLTSRIIPINKGLGSKQEKIQIACASDNLGGSSLLTSSSHNADLEWVEIITLDSYVKEHNIEVGLIKVDIEGFEMEFLKGVEWTIKNQKPALIISIYHQASDFFDIKPMIESWNIGYKFQIIKPTNCGIMGETVLLCEKIDMQ